MSSDSSDEENLDQLREAADQQFINDSMFKNVDNNANNKKREKSHLPSLRPVKVESDQFNVLDVTPEFQQHIAKRLSNILEERIIKRLGTQKVKASLKSESEQQDGIKLFSESTIRSQPGMKPNKIKSKKRKLQERKRENENVNFEEIAVKPEDILDYKEVRHWSTWSRSKVFKYKRLKNGKLEQIEPKFV